MHVMATDGRQVWVLGIVPTLFLAMCFQIPGLKTQTVQPPPSQLYSTMEVTDELNMSDLGTDSNTTPALTWEHIATDSMSTRAVTWEHSTAITPLHNVTDSNATLTSTHITNRSMVDKTSSVDPLLNVISLPSISAPLTPISKSEVHHHHHHSSGTDSNRYTNSHSTVLFGTAPSTISQISTVYASESFARTSISLQGNAPSHFEAIITTASTSQTSIIITPSPSITMPTIAMPSLNRNMSTPSITMPTPSLLETPSVSSTPQAFDEFSASTEYSDLIGSYSTYAQHNPTVDQSDIFLESSASLTSRLVDLSVHISMGAGDSVSQSESSFLSLIQSSITQDSSSPGVLQTTNFISATDTIMPSEPTFSTPLSSHRSTFSSSNSPPLPVIPTESLTASETLVQIASSFLPGASLTSNASLDVGTSTSIMPGLTTALTSQSLLTASSELISPTPSRPIPIMSSTLLPGTTRAATTTQKPTTTIPSTTPGIQYWTLEKGLSTQNYWLATVLTVPTNQDLKDVLFIIELEQGFAEAYDEGKRRESQENREIQQLLAQLDPDINPLVIDRRKKRATSHGSYTVQMIDQIRDVTTPTSVRVVFYVTEGGTKYTQVDSYTSAAVYGRLTLQELTVFLNYPVETEIKSYNGMMNPTTVAPPASSSNLWIIAAVLVPFFIIFLCVCCCCCMLMQKKRDTDIDPDTLKIIHFKQKYPYRPYQPGNTPHGYDVAKNGVDNNGVVVVDGTVTTKTAFHVENDLDGSLTQPPLKRIDDEYVVSETDSSVNMENEGTGRRQGRALPPLGGTQGHVTKLPDDLTNQQPTKKGDPNAGKKKEKKKKRRKKTVGPEIVDEKITRETLPETHGAGPPAPDNEDDENSQEPVSETQKRLHALLDDAFPLADKSDLTADNAPHHSLIHVEPTDPSQVQKAENELFPKREGPKILIVPVTKVPDNGGGVVWSTYDAFDGIDKLTSKKTSSSGPSKNEPKPITLKYPDTGAELTLQISETPRPEAPDKTKNHVPDKDASSKTPNNKVQFQDNSYTRPLTISQLLASRRNKTGSAPVVKPQDTSVGGNTGEFSSGQMTDSLEMGTQWAQPAFMDTLENGAIKTLDDTHRKDQPLKLNWSLGNSTPREEPPETKTPREQVELDMLSSAKLERTAGKPKGEDYDEMDVARSVKTGENPQPLIRVIREELNRLQRRGTPTTEL